MTTRRRLDQALVARGLVDTRSVARRIILAGQVWVDGTQINKPGTPVRAASQIRLKNPPRFVSRGGDKLLAAINQSGIRTRERICLDVGASTGGFTDCLLQRGASVVVAVDVGYGQLDWRLRTNKRVHVLERRNARHLSAHDLPDGLPPPNLLVVDVAFIGLAKVLPAATSVCAPDADALLLVKPQFECGSKEVERGGVVRSATARRDAIRSVGHAAVTLGWQAIDTIPSPLRGPAGNWECFLHLRRPPIKSDDTLASLDDILDNLTIPEDGPKRSTVPARRPSIRRLRSCP